MNDIDTQVAQERAVEAAEKDLTWIEQLLDHDAYNKYFVRRLKERREMLRTKIADDDTLSHEETRLMRAIVKEIDAILAMPLQDRGAHHKTISLFRRSHNGPARG